MNNNALSTVAAILAVTAAVSQPALAATDGTLNFSGLVNDVTCTVEGSAPGTGAVVKDVNLGGVAAARLANPGE
jgi:major type 1 subunit fimbrin (pilin)